MAIVGVARQNLRSTGDLGAAETVTLDAAGVAALSGPGYYKLDTYEGAAEDSTVRFTGLAAGKIAMIVANNDNHTVVIADGTYIKCRRGFKLNNQYDGAIVFSLDGSTCIVFRSNYGD